MYEVKDLEKIFSKYACPDCGRKLQVINDGRAISNFDIEHDTTEGCRNFIMGLNRLYIPFYLNNAPLTPVVEYLEQHAQKLT